VTKESLRCFFPLFERETPQSRTPHCCCQWLRPQASSGGTALLRRRSTLYSYHRAAGPCSVFPPVHAPLMIRIRYCRVGERRVYAGTTLREYGCRFTAMDLFSSPENQKVFKILRHIESYDTCMKH